MVQQNVGDIILRDTTANKPAATAVTSGTLYYDTDLNTLERSNGTTWQTYGGGGGATTLDGLTDVVITAAATGDILRYNGTNWVDYADASIQATIVDAKGDIIAATAADTVARLAVGTNEQVLSAASGESTGLKWAPSTRDVAFSFTANGSAYYTAFEAMTFDAAYAGGSGTLAYAKALAADTTTFSAASLPITLAQGDVLRVTISSITTYKAVTLHRSA